MLKLFPKFIKKKKKELDKKDRDKKDLDKEDLDKEDLDKEDLDKKDQNIRSKSTLYQYIGLYLNGKLEKQ